MFDINAFNIDTNTIVPAVIFGGNGSPAHPASTSMVSPGVWSRSLI